MNSAGTEIQSKERIAYSWYKIVQYYKIRVEFDSALFALTLTYPPTFKSNLATVR